MKLSTKMRISFCVLILMPVILFSAAVFGIIRFSMYDIEEQYNTTGTPYTALANPVALVSKMCESEYNKLIHSAENSPEDFDNSAFLDEINAELLKRNSYLLVVEDGECKYAGREGYEEVLDKLQDIDYGGSNTGIYLKQKYNILINNVRYILPDGRKGRAFVVMQVKDIIPQVKRLLYDGIIAVIIILVLTSGLFVSWMYRTMVNPINKLKLATHNIKNGNLDFDLDVSGKDEISELCRDFDAMRVRLKENAEEKIKSDAEGRELLSNICHDLKTPITAVKGYAEGILDGVASNPEKLEKYIRTIYNKACDMDKLIDELTLYSKMDSNKVVYQFSKINVSDYFAACTEELALDLESMGIKLIFENNLEPSVETVADVEQLKRVINNIVGNSVKYMDHENGQVKITLKDMGKQFGIDIWDNGPGIKEEDLPYIFDRFYRADASRNSAKGGSGIGLSIVKKIIYDHNGTITVESTPGEGTTMYIVLDKYVEITPPFKRITN